MVARLISVLVAAMIAAPGHAAPTQGCFTRSYTPEHLAAHPDQIVAAIRAHSFAEWITAYEGAAAELVSFIRLDVLAADQGHVAANGQAGQVMWAMPMCHPPQADREVWICSIDGDAGSIEILRDDGRVFEFRTQGMMIGDWEAVFEDPVGGTIKSFNLAETPGDYVTYRLFRVDDGICDTDWPETEG